jgi:hypothetical protein
VAEPGTYAVCILSERQCAQLPGRKNFGSKHSPEGNCLGYVYTAKTMLTQLVFDPRKPANADATRRAIVEAHRSGTRQVIPGYANLGELVREADRAWVDDADEKDPKAAAKLHPVQRAMIDLQRDQPGLLHTLLNARLLKGTTKTSTELAEKMDARLRVGIPTQLAIRTLAGKDGHAVMAVGFESTSEDKTATKFFILDPNQPEALQTLRLEKLGIPGVKDDTYWMYDALGWHGAGLDAVDEATKKVKGYASEKNPVVRLAQQIPFAQSVEELKRLKGGLKVEAIKDKVSTEKLVQLALRPHVLPTDPPDMEQFNRVFGRMFGVRGTCPAPGSATLPHQPAQMSTAPTHQIRR